MGIEERLVHFVVRGNWVVLALFCSAALWVEDPAFFRGVLFGGLIVTINFHMLGRTLKNSFKPPHLAAVHSIIAKYYLRFIISGIIISILIFGRFVAPVGLVLGLSVVVVTLFCAAIVALMKILSSKEAA
ncbi:ATP synthase I subunit [Desulfobotulus alkaliphilus]|uniref:ATP synthase I subunit n=1 Tax=Desulfobotulus alkaliphilus TaxID=622671 RepID=A0A562RPB3_9BACT|nr:ATP synthase subunit I [Desulfobotulus alkaliphilus]TWI70773.1 ATP synthase I subunit [Desulfobotulus alkaliphilus]